MLKPYALVGHRGLPAHYPENTLSGLLAAIAEGADAIEFDIQISKDGVPVIIHDDSLDRTTGVKGQLADYSAALLNKISAHEPERFGESHLPEPIITLEALAEQLVKWPEIEIFAEIKAEIFERYSRDVLMNRVAGILEPLKAHCRVISFDIEILYLAKAKGFQVGWVLSHYDPESLLQAQQLNPSFLICDYNKLPDSLDPPWPGPWQWFVYDIVNAVDAKAAIARSIRYIETWDLVSLTQALHEPL